MSQSISYTRQNYFSWWCTGTGTFHDNDVTLCFWLIIWDGHLAHSQKDSWTCSLISDNIKYEVWVNLYLQLYKAQSCRLNHKSTFQSKKKTVFFLFINNFACWYNNYQSVPADPRPPSDMFRSRPFNRHVKIQSVKIIYQRTKTIIMMMINKMMIK